MRVPVAIFPFCAEILPIVDKFEKLQDEFALKALISPHCLGLAGHDAGYACNHPEVGFIVTDELNMKYEDWTTLILYEPVQNKKIDYAYENIAEQAVLFSIFDGVFPNINFL